MKDFDYIGTGGFVIECSDGVVGVLKAQAESMKKRSSYFERCFSIEMVEQKKNTLQKPDWTVAIARYVVELLVGGCIHVYSLQMYETLLDATDQILVDMRLCDFEDGFPLPKFGHNFLALVQCPVVFHFSGDITMAQWTKLLKLGVLLHPGNSTYMFRNPMEGISADFAHGKPLGRRTYAVHTKKCPSSTMLQLREFFKPSRSESMDVSKETFTIESIHLSRGDMDWKPMGMEGLEYSFKEFHPGDCSICASPGVLLFACLYSPQGICLKSAELSIPHPTKQTLDCIFFSEDKLSWILDLDTNTYRFYRNLDQVLKLFTDYSDEKRGNSRNYRNVVFLEDDGKQFSVSCYGNISRQFR